MSKEPTRAQLSSRLAYQAHTPAFLLRMQQRVGGRGPADDEDDEEFEDYGSGRPPIPKRPAIPERPADEPGSDAEDDLDEKPQVVVLKEGKHLTERDAENERRKAKGLPPLPEPTAGSHTEASSAKDDKPAAPKAAQSQGLSFSSGAGAKPKNAKRKAVGDGRDTPEDGPPAKPSKKKAKKPEKKKLSFGDDA